MSAENKVTLLAKSVFYYSYFDEAAFFEWLDKISCVSSYGGKGVVLEIEINADSVDESNLRDLLALFYRYNVDMKQFSVFDNKKFSGWLRNPEAYWFDSVFK